MKEISKILEDGAYAIDITPSMFEEAKSHYSAMGSYLENNDIMANISPCGSIVMGTIVRPLLKDDNDYFDIDVIVKRMDLEKKHCTPSDVRDPVEDALRSSDRYKDRIENCDECITLLYVSNGKEGGFRLDLDACVADLANPKATACETHGDYADDAVAIAKKAPDDWLGSNPNGLCDWFLTENQRFANAGRMKRKEAVFSRNQTLYESVEEVPDLMDRSALQRAVQIAKRSRDEHYRMSRLDNKPTSCVLTVLMAKVSKDLPDDASVLDILTSFTERLQRDKLLVELGESCLIGASGHWDLSNPVYDENMLDGWGNSDVNAFFRWAETLGADLAGLQQSNAKKEAAAASIFGKKVKENILPATAGTAAAVVPHKPWRSI